MDFVGLTSSFLTVIGFAIQLYKDCSAYIDAVRGDCPNDLKVILTENASLEVTLRIVESLWKACDDPEEAKRQEKHLGGLLQACAETLKEMMKLVPTPMLKGDAKLSKREKAKLMLHALKWGHDKSKCDQLMANLAKYKDSLNMGLTSRIGLELKMVAKDVKEIKADVKEVKTDVKDTKTNVKEVKTTVNTMEAKLDRAQRDKVHTWLETVNPTTNHNTTLELNEGGTCQWLGQNKEWNEWLNGRGQSRFLRVHGLPGSGKTILACSMIQRVHHRVKTANDKAGTGKKEQYAYYYCYNGRNQDETTHFLRWIVGQFCRASNYIPVILNDVHRANHQPTISQLLNALEAVLTRFSNAYVIVDAVDESKAPRETLVSVLSKLGNDARFGNLQIAITSRNYPDIADGLKGGSVPLSMDNQGVRDEIRAYLEKQLGQAKYQPWKPELKKDVIDKVSTSANGMFRYAVCQLQILGKCGNPKEVAEKIQRMPKDLYAMYNGILRGIDESHREYVRAALCLIMGVQTDLGEISSKMLAQGVYGEDSFYDFKTLRDHCTGLIDVRSNDTVVLAHYTVREFLTSNEVELRNFKLDQETIYASFLTTVFKIAANFSGRVPSTIPKDKVGKPVVSDFNLYALLKARHFMSFDTEAVMKVMTADEAKQKSLIRLLNPHNVSFSGLRSIAYDPKSNFDKFQWATQFNTSKDVPALEQRAAHLTMLIGLGRANLVNAYLKDKKDDEKKALFSAEMRVMLPMRWAMHKNRGAMETGWTTCNVLSFYEEGQKRGFGVDDQLRLLRGTYAAYPPKSAPASASKPQNATSHPSTGSTPQAQPAHPQSNTSHGKPTPTSGPTPTSSNNQTRPPPNQTPNQSSQSRPTPTPTGAHSQSTPNASNTSNTSSNNNQTRPPPPPTGQSKPASTSAPTNTSGSQGKPQATSASANTQGNQGNQGNQSNHGRPTGTPQAQVGGPNTGGGAGRNAGGPASSRDSR